MNFAGNKTIQAIRTFLGRYSKMIAVGLVLRFLLMPFTSSGDLVWIAWISSFVSQGHVDVYRHYFEQYGTVLFPPEKPVFCCGAAFPPLFYLLYGAYLFVLHSLKIFSFMNVWAVANVTFKQVGLALQDDTRVFFFMKAFYLPFDLLGLGMFVACLDGEKRDAAAWAWVLSPAILYVTYGWGQIDIMASSFMMAALYFARRAILTRRSRDGILSCVSVGLSASFKLFPLALLPIFSLFLSKRTGRSSPFYMAAGISPLFLAVPFVSGPFLDSILNRLPTLTSRSIAGPYGQFTIYIIFAAYLAVICYLYLIEVDHSFDKLLAFGLAIFSIFYGLSAWLPNWILWVLPLLLLVIFRRPALFGVYLLMNVFYFLFVQAWGNRIWLGLFYPLASLSSSNVEPETTIIYTFPHLWDLFPTAWVILVGLAYTGLGTCMFFMTYYVWRARDGDSVKLHGWHWLIIFLVPLSMACVTLFLVRAHIQKYGLPIVETLNMKIAADPAFFTFYLIAIGAFSIWLLYRPLTKTWEKLEVLRKQRSMRLPSSLL